MDGWDLCDGGIYLLYTTLLQNMLIFITIRSLGFIYRICSVDIGIGSSWIHVNYGVVLHELFLCFLFFSFFLIPSCSFD